jgi:hypothetical protein
MQVFSKPLVQKAGLYKLPHEILRAIFFLSRTEDEPLTVKHDPGNYFHLFYEKQTLAMRGIGLSCRQAYLDITEYQFFYTNNNFKFASTETALCWLHRRTQGERVALRSLSLTYGGLHLPGILDMFPRLTSLSTLTLDISPLLREGGRRALLAIFGRQQKLPGMNELATLPATLVLNLALEGVLQEDDARTRKVIFDRYRFHCGQMRIVCAMRDVGRLLPFRISGSGSAWDSARDAFLAQGFGAQLEDIRLNWKYLRMTEEEK